MRIRLLSAAAAAGLVLAGASGPGHLGAAVAQAAKADFYQGQAAYRKQNFGQAFRIWKPLAERGDIRAAFGMARLYFYGLGGVDKNDLEAAKWYTRAAKAGHLEAQFQIARMYALGYGVDQNYREAIRWYTSAGRRGHIKAMVELGDQYANGRFIPKSERRARLWYRQAAVRGSTIGMIKLAEMLAGSTRIPRDYRRAYTWLLIAEAKGSRAARAKRIQMLPRFYDGEVDRAKVWAKEYLTRGKLPPKLKNEM